MNSQWRCATCGPVAPLWIAPRASAEVVETVTERLRRTQEGHDPVPLWCPWPLPSGWTVTGVAWAGDDREGPRASALALSGPAPLHPGPADVVFVAEEIGVGLGSGLGGLGSVEQGLPLDPGPALQEAVEHDAPQAKVRVGNHPTPLWSVPAGPGRSVHVGEARAMWLYVVAWPPEAAYLLMDGIRLHDLVDSVPAELVFGAESGRLRPVPAPSGTNPPDGDTGSGEPANGAG